MAYIRREHFVRIDIHDDVATEEKTSITYYLRTQLNSTIRFAIWIYISLQHSIYVSFHHHHWSEWCFRMLSSDFFCFLTSTRHRPHIHIFWVRLRLQNDGNHHQIYSFLIVVLSLFFSDSPFLLSIRAAQLINSRILITRFQQKRWLALNSRQTILNNEPA